MTEQETLKRHAHRVLNGWPAPKPAQLERELRCASHYAYEGLERIQNMVMNTLLAGLTGRPNPEPVPEWKR